MYAFKAVIRILDTLKVPTLASWLWPWHLHHSITDTPCWLSRRNPHSALHGAGPPCQTSVPKNRLFRNTLYLWSWRRKCSSSCWIGVLSFSADDLKKKKIEQKEFDMTSLQSSSVTVRAALFWVLQHFSKKVQVRTGYEHQAVSLGSCHKAQLGVKGYPHFSPQTQECQYPLE